MDTGPNVKEERIASKNCVQYLDGEDIFEIQNEEIEGLDIAEQFVVDNEVHDRDSWRIKNEYINQKTLPQRKAANKLVPTIDEDNIHHNEVNFSNICIQDVVSDVPSSCGCDTYEYISSFQKMLDTQIKNHLEQIRQRCKQKSKINEVIDWELLARSVKERPVLWNKFLDIYTHKIGKTVAWREVCVIVKEDFEEMALEDPEHLEQAQITPKDTSLLRSEGWACSDVDNTVSKEDSGDVPESNVCLHTDEIISQSKFEIDDCTNSRSSPTIETSIGESEKTSTRCQLNPLYEATYPRKILSENENNFTTNRKYKRIKERNYCYYCEAPVLNFARHVERSHSEEEEVQRIMSTPKNSKMRKALLTRLRKKGNYLKCSDWSKPIRSSPLAATRLYAPCPYCLGFYSSKQLWRHKRKCNENPLSKTNINSTDQSFEKSTRLQTDLQRKVFPRMRPDKISIVAQLDHLICAFGARYLKLHRKPYFVHVTSRKMRELSKLLIEIMKSENIVITLMDVLQPKYYDTIVRATKQICHYDSKEKCFKSPNLAVNMGVSLRQCCDIAVSYASENFAAEIASEAESAIRILASLIEGNWRYDLFGEAPDTENSPKPKQTNDSKPHEESDSCNNELNSDQQIIETGANIDENCVTTILTEGTTPIDVKEYGNERKQNRKRKIIQRIAWTAEQKKVVLRFFKIHIELKKPPKKHECDELIAQNRDLLWNKSWLKIKVFIQNVYTKKYKV